MLDMIDWYDIKIYVFSYELDDSSPIDDEDNVYPYEILSKINKRLEPVMKNHFEHCCPGHDHHH